MKIRILIALAAAALSTACAKMQEIERVAPTQAQAASGLGKTKTFAYEKTVLRTTPGTSTMTIQVGLTCVPRAEAVTSQDNYSETSTILQDAIRQEFERAGYSTVGMAPGGALFTDNRAADYRIAAVVTRPKMNVCVPLAAYSKDEGYGEASLTIEWQIYSNAQNAVVFTSQQKGYVKIESSVPRPIGALWSGAYASAVRGLLADPGFIALVNSGRAS
jgi:hypothetical protein